jgi:hypothetical protein
MQYDHHTAERMKATTALRPARSWWKSIRSPADWEE